MKRTLFILQAVLGSYLFMAFVQWEENPRYWSDSGRFMFVLVLAVAVCFAWVATIRMRSFEKFLQEREEHKVERNRKAGGFTSLLQKQLDAANEARRQQEQKQTKP